MQLSPEPSVLGTGASLVAVLVSLFGLATTLVWLWIGWRAMRAHERIADVLLQRSREK